MFEALQLSIQIDKEIKTEDSTKLKKLLQSFVDILLEPDAISKLEVAGNPVERGEISVS